MPETATTEMDAVMEVVTTTKNAIVRGIVTVNATAVTPEDAIGMCGRETAGHTPNRTTVSDDRERKKRVHRRNRPV